MSDIKSGRNLLLIFIAIVIVLIVIIAAPFIYQSWEETFTPTNDRDGDGVPDGRDAFPDDPDEWADNDGDGIGDNADPDDDNDGILDSRDWLPFNDGGIRVEIDSIRIKDDPSGSLFPPETTNVYAVITINEASYIVPNDLGEEVSIDVETKVNWSAELNVDDSVANHEITLQLFFASSFAGRIIDINNESAEKTNEGRTIRISYHIGDKVGHQFPANKNYITYDGSEDGNYNPIKRFDEKDAKISFRIVTVDVRQ
jgi:hypothetical protein